MLVLEPDIDATYEEDFVGNEGDAYEDTDREANRETTRESGREGSKRGVRGETRGESSSESRGEARSSRSSRGKSRRQGGATAARKHPDPAESVFGDLPLSLDAENNEREIIQKFTTGNINTEIWFVAIGSELANNAGMKNFIKQHKEELRGAIFLDLDGLGVGDLSVIEEEGLYLPVKINSRLKRYVTKASASLGLHVKNAKMRWRDSGAFIASKAGHPTLHIARMKDGKPAYAAQADDVFANLDEEMLKESSDFALEILRNI